MAGDEQIIACMALLFKMEDVCFVPIKVVMKVFEKQ